MWTAKTLIRLSGCPGWSKFAGRTYHFVGLVMRGLSYVDFAFPRLILLKTVQYSRLLIITDEPRHEKMCLGVSDQAKHKPVCAATEASHSNEISAIESRDILSKQRTTKALIRLRGCAVWSAPLLFAYDIRHIFTWPGSDLLIVLSQNMTKPAKLPVHPAKTHKS